MLIIRLQRVGRKNDPNYRIIITDKRKAMNTGAFLEILGSYDPRKNRVDLKEDRIKHWLAHGAQASGTVHNLLVDAKIIQGKKRKVSPTPPAKSADAEEQKEGTAKPAKTKEEVPEPAETKERVKKEPDDEAETEEPAKADEAPKTEKEAPAPATEEPAENKPEDPAV